MGAFELKESLERAEKRLGSRPAGRPRRDRGRSRLAPRVRTALEGLLRGQERPPVRQLMRELTARCGAAGERPPARATVYEFMARTPAPSYPIADLPAPAREALYNLDPAGRVPGHQLAFYCLNYGGLHAVSFAAGMPWLALYQAARLPGWRPRSRGLLDAVLRARGI